MHSHISNLIDIHTHILPGLDDGPKSVQESIRLARCFERSGIKTIVATPHYLAGTAWAASRQKVLQRLQELQRVLEYEHIDLQVFSGMEIAYDKRLPDRLKSDSLLSLAGSGFYLIEPSFHGEQKGLLGCLHELLQDGFKLILAHPERIEFFQHQPEVLKELVNADLHIQVNIGSLIGHYGRECQACAEKLWYIDCLHYIASDAHDHNRRRPGTNKDWLKLLSFPFGEKLLQSCIKNVNELFTVREDKVSLRKIN